MRKFFFIPLLIFFSCNPSEKETTPDPEESEEQVLQKAISSHPDSSLLHEELIQYYRDQNNIEKALSEAENVLKKDTLNARMHYIKGIMLTENEDTAAGIHSIETAARLQPTTEYLLRLATLYAATKNGSVLELLDEMSKFNIAPEKLLYIKGSYFLALNDLQKGIACMDQALAINFTFMEAYREKALALYNQQKYTAALQVLNKAVTLQNSFEEGYFYIGQCLEKLHRNEEAIQAYEKALMYDARYTEAKDALEQLEKKLNK